jgi:hypothetical protein
MHPAYVAPYDIRSLLIVAMATPPELAASVSRAISKADVDTLRTLLTALYNESDVVRQELHNRVLVPASRASKKRKASTGDKETTDTSPNKEPKGLISRYEVCATCKKTFDVTKNDEKACQLHPGTRTVLSPGSSRQVKGKLTNSDGLATSFQASWITIN